MEVFVVFASIVQRWVDLDLGTYTFSFQILKLSIAGDNSLSIEVGRIAPTLLPDAHAIAVSVSELS